MIPQLIVSRVNLRVTKGRTPNTNRSIAKEVSIDGKRASDKKTAASLFSNKNKVQYNKKQGTIETALTQHVCSKR